MVRRRAPPYPCRDHNPSWALGRGLTQGRGRAQHPSAPWRHHLIRPVLHDELLLVGREAQDVARVKVEDRIEVIVLSPGAAQGLSTVEQAEDGKARAEGMSRAAEARQDALAATVAAS